MSEHIYVSTNIIRSIYFIYEISLINPNFITVLPGGSDSKAFAYNAGDLGSIPGSGKSPGEGNGYPILKNSMDRGAWRITSMGSQRVYTTEQLILSQA